MQKVCILNLTIKNPLMFLEICLMTENGGLSGEHIKLCAEGARRKPNLSGERTEMQVSTTFVALVSSPLKDCLFL